MSIRASAAALSEAVKDLLLQWDQTGAQWRDAKAREFERTYLAELPHHAARATNVIEEIDAILRKVRSDCE